MTAIFVESPMSEERRREHLYRGDLFLFQPRPSTRALCDLASTLLAEGFAPHDPRTIHRVLPPEECAAALGRIKPTFTHHPEAKRIIRDLLAEFDCDLDQTFFDIPRMRSAYAEDYLTSGVAYAFHPHRDTWYSAPQCQLNWWMPIHELAPDNGINFYPPYFDQPIENTSACFNYYRWNSYRSHAAQFVKSDPREQPKALKPVALPDLRPLVPPGGIILFAAAHLHGTVPNTSGLARYSIDFRTVNQTDLERRVGAPNVDSQCTGTTLRDYLNATSLERLNDQLVAAYDDQSAVGAMTLYQPDHIPTELGAAQ